MKCRFCGKRIKKNSNICSKCGKEVTEGLGTDELIDAMPELHDEFDNIAKIQEKERKKKERKEKRAQHRTRRIVIAVIVILAILGAVFCGMLYLKDKKQQQLEAEQLKQQQMVSSSIDSSIQKSFISSGFTDKVVTDSVMAKSVIAEQKSVFSFVNADSEFELAKEFKIGSSTVYRFMQKYNQIPVYGGEMVLMTDSSGNVIGLNGVYIPTEGLPASYKLDEGNASTAITEYVNSLNNLAVVDGINITEVQKTIVNKDKKAYVAYFANVSGYNSSSEYIAYDVFVDASTGDGICVFVTSSFENETTVTENEIEESYIYKMATASDKFNWNDDTLEISKDPINIEDIEAGNSSAYVTSIKNALDSAYNYFSDAFGYRGLTGDGESFTVYINPNEYVEEVLPTEKAMYTNQKLMFFREDLTQGDLDYNTAMHEYAHGVMHNIVGFRGTMDFSENSAIAEGLADVFAELAEATVNGTCDWIHGERLLYEPQEGYLSYIPQEISIKTVADCYSYSTIVSHLASHIAEAIPDVSLQNELWFKTMCFMTRSTDFGELSTIINAVAANMHSEYKLTDTQYQQFLDILRTLNGSELSEVIE